MQQTASSHDCTFCPSPIGFSICAADSYYFDLCNNSLTHPFGWRTVRLITWHFAAWKPWRSAQFSLRWYLCSGESPYALHPVSRKFSNVVFEIVGLIDDGLLRSFERRSSNVSHFYASFLEAIDGMMSLALYQQHFRSSQTQATWNCWAASLSIRSVISLHSGMSRAVHPQKFSKVDVDHWHGDMVHGCMVYTKAPRQQQFHVARTSHVSAVSTPLRWIFKKAL